MVGLRNPEIRFLLSALLMDARLIENLSWKASSHPSSTWEENASFTCSLTVSSLKKEATSLENTGCSCSILNLCPILQLLGFLQSDFPIPKWFILFCLVSDVPGAFTHILGSTVLSVPSVSSPRLNLNLLHRTTTRTALLVAWISHATPSNKIKTNC